jgi:hypothetical protein
MNVASHDLSAHVSEILESHLKVGPQKPVSYLPINTIENVIGIAIPVYVSMIESSGNKSIVFKSDECCIKSGAVYAYSERDLVDVLNINRERLSDHGWPADVDNFIRRIASEWLDEGSLLMPVVRAAFGDLDMC